jgi:hypothetical protein
MMEIIQDMFLDCTTCTTKYEVPIRFLLFNHPTQLYEETIFKDFTFICFHGFNIQQKVMILVFIVGTILNN